MNSEGKMTSKTMAVIFAAVVIVLFMTATLALVTSAMEEEAKNPKQPSVNPNNAGPQAPSLDFESQEFEAVVKYSLPALIIIGDTKEASAEKIDAQFAAIDGVRGIDKTQSAFVGNEGGTLKYKETLVLENDADKTAVFNEIQQKITLLQNMQPISMVVIQLPETLTVTNSDINLSKEFTPAQRNVQAFSSLGTTDGDMIKAVLKVTLSNDVPLQMQAFENSNMTGQAMTFFENPVAKITELDRLIYVQGDMNAENFIDENALKQGLQKEELYAIDSVNVQVYDENTHEAGFFAQLALNSEDSRPAFEFLQAFFAGKKILFKAAQPAKTDLNAVFVHDLNQSIGTNSESLWIMAKTGHSVGEDLNFSLMISVQRGKIVSSQGAEE